MTREQMISEIKRIKQIIEHCTNYEHIAIYEQELRKLENKAGIK